MGAMRVGGEVVDLPSPDGELEAEAQRARAVVDDIRSGVASARSILGLLSVDSRPLDAAARLESLRTVLARERAIQTGLARQRARWDECLGDVSAAVQRVVEERAEQLRRLEHKRAQLADVAREQADTELAARTAALGARLERSLGELSAGVAALLRRCASLGRALAAWEASERERADLISALERRIDARARMLDLEQEMARLERAPAAEDEAGATALVGELLEPLAQRADAARRADERLREEVAALLLLAGGLEREPPEVVGAEAERAAGERLLAAPLDGAAAFAAALDDAAPAAAPARPRSLDERLLVVEAATRHGCLELGEESLLQRVRKVDDVHHWRDYLKRYPGGREAASARDALLRFDAGALAAAEAARTRGAWSAYLRDFPEGMGGAKAREALAALPVAPPATDVLRRLAAPPEGAVFLGDLQPLECRVGWGTLRVNEGGRVLIDGQPCERFLLAHAPARVVYAVPEGAMRFTAVGTRIDARETVHGTWRYEVHVDDRPAFRSPALHDQPDGIPIDVELPAGAKRLTLVVDDFGDGHWDWSVLAAPCFHKGAAGGEPPRS